MSLADQLQTYLTRLWDQPAAVRDLARIPGGASRETYRFDVDVGGETKGLILRRDPVGSLIDTDRRLEFMAYRSFFGRGVPVPEAVTAAHGAYVANGCIGCHGKQLAGGRIPGAPPSWPPAAKLTPGPGSALDRYPTAEQFMAMLKSGRRPDGSKVSDVMPFTSLKALSELDMRALYLHLRSLPSS